MCLSVPAKVIALKDEVATVEIGTSTTDVGTQLLENIQPGDYVLVHAGFAIQKLSEKDALIQLELIKTMRAEK